MYGNCKYAYIKRSFKMNIRYDNGLLFIDIKISYLGKSKLIKNVVIDTGASHTIISPDIVSSIGISASPLDKFITMYGIGGEHYAYRKKIDSISICGMDLKDIEIDFGGLTKISGCIWRRVWCERTSYAGGYQGKGYDCRSTCRYAGISC